MLIDRLRSAAVLIVFAVSSLYVDAQFSTAGVEGFFLVPLLLFFTLGTAWDMTGLLNESGRSVWRGGCLIAVAAISLGPAIPTLVNGVAHYTAATPTYPADCPIGRLGWAITMAIASVFALLIWEMRTYGLASSADSLADNSSAIDRTMRATFVSLYIGLPMSLLFAIRSLGTDGSTTWGLAGLLTMIATTKSADSGAYFAGKAFGRHKLIPRLSPGKTWEGVIGGVLMSTLVAFACLRWLFPAIVGTGVTTPSLNWTWVLGPALALSGMLGDLSESMFKRDCDAKDSGNWLPGLGGVWDVTDSLIAGVLPAFLCLAAAA